MCVGGGGERRSRSSTVDRHRDGRELEGNGKDTVKVKLVHGGDGNGKVGMKTSTIDHFWGGTPVMIDRVGIQS